IAPIEALDNPHPSWKDPQLMDLLIQGKINPTALKTLNKLGFDLNARLQEDRSLIHQAVLSGTSNENQAIALIQELITHGLNLDAIDARRRTTLDITMQENLKKIFCFLVNKGAVKANWDIALQFYEQLNPN